MSASQNTPTLPPRIPDGWWFAHPRYRAYVLFAATGLVLSAVNAVLLVALAAVADGFASWQALMASGASLPGLALVAALLLGTLFFALRWLRVGAKIPAVRLGPVPAPSMGLVLIGHYAGFVTVSLLILIVLSGVII